MTTSDPGRDHAPRHAAHTGSSADHDGPRRRWLVAPEAPRPSPALSGVSGRRSALVLLALLVGSGVLVPLALHRALWVDAEAVLGAWFVIWTIALEWLGVAGRAVERDWDDGHDRRGSGGDHSFGCGNGLGAIDLGGTDLGEGCAGPIFGLLVIVVAAIVLSWLVPIMALVLYAAVRALLNRVGDHAEATRGRLVPALRNAALWAGVYTAPLALGVWALHVAQ